MNQKVKAIPEGYHSLTPHLSINGAEQAIKFYQDAFGAKLKEKHFAPDGKKIMHAVMEIGNSLFMLADEFPNSACGVASPSTLKGTTQMLHIYVEDVDTAFAKAVKAGAQVKMPLEDTFWGDRYGQLADPFGHGWSLSTHKRDISHEEVEKKAKEMVKEKKKCCSC